MRQVKVWEEEITIPTYRACRPETAPLFLENRAYQGSSGKVYPFPVTEKISDEKEDVTYQAVFLENEYLQVMVLPQLGGRIQRALDKTNGYDFVYYNHVVKPAPGGLCRPGIFHQHYAQRMEGFSRPLPRCPAADAFLRVRQPFPNRNRDIGEACVAQVPAKHTGRAFPVR